MRNFKQYTIDTNVIRYQAGNAGNQGLDKAARIFWRTVKEKVDTGEAAILVPAEVIRELEVQSHNLSAIENSKINLILKNCIEVSPPVSVQLEHQVRNMSAYLRKHYQEDLTNLPMSYPGVSDARILYSAYYEDSILVTANIKDFLLYPFLFAHQEKCLYTLLSNNFIQIPETVYAKVWQDKAFKEMFKHLGELESALED